MHNIIVSHTVHSYPGATDSGKSGHTQYVFVYANSAGCPEEHFDGDTLSHGRDDDEGGLSGAHIKSTQLTREDTDCFQVLTSYEPVRWRLSVTSGVTIDRVILSGYYASTVTSSPSNAIRQTETLRDPDNHYGYGTDLGGGRTAELLLYLQQRFGPVTSFSGSYRADRWELNIHRTSGCSFNNMTRNCPLPSAPENGAVNVTGVQPIVARYSCNEGTLLGPEMRTCLESGWSGEEPSCRT
ncbi:hypothetical protein GBAR_LOCUS23500, partial [Geodia barretti]